MTELAEVAFAFAKECLGWESDRTSFADGNSIRKVKPFQSADHFYYTDLNAVMEAMRGWCEQHEAVLLLAYGKAKTFNAMVDVWNVQGAVGNVEHADPCYALLAACVEAQRKLKP